jgi:hypothetical protein
MMPIGSGGWTFFYPEPKQVDQKLLLKTAYLLRSPYLAA